MAATYSGNPAASPLDEVRFLISDTDMTKALLQDAEINYNLYLVSPDGPPASGNFLAAAYCSDALRAKFARLADSKSVGDLSISFSAQAQRFADLSNRLRQRATLKAVPIYVGGQSISEKKELDTDPDRVQPAAKVDGLSMLYPNTNQSGGSSGV